MSDLDDILDETPPAATQAPEAPAPAAQEPSPLPEGSKDAERAADSSKRILREKELIAQEEGRGNVRDPVSGKFVKAEEVQAAAPAVAPPAAPVQPPQQELTPKEKAFFAGMQDERNKRQALERELAEERARRNPPPPPADPMQDPEGFHRQQAEQHAQTQANAERTARITKREVAEMIARQRYPDFDTKVQAFAQMTQSNPMLVTQMDQQLDPAEFAYQTGKAAIDRFEWEQAGGADGMRKKLEAEIRAKVDAEYKAKQEQSAKLRADLPGSLTDVPSAANARAVFTGPPSLDDILH